jgi:hypothetical protein
MENAPRVPRDAFRVVKPRFNEAPSAGDSSMRLHGYPCLVVSILFSLLAVACTPGSRSSDSQTGIDDDASTESRADADVPGFCGDGVVEAPETCDPPSSCPTSCPTMQCKQTTAAGLAATCNLECGYTDITQCVGGDHCCAPGCQASNDYDCTGIRIDSTYESRYQLVDLGPVPGVPTRVGGVVVKAGDPGKLLVGGTANQLSGAFYEIAITRDDEGHITGFSGSATRVADAAYNDGGVIYGPDGVLLFARWPANELGEIKPGSLVTDKVVDLEPLGVGYSAAGIAFAPAGSSTPGALKIMSWSSGLWHTVALTPDGMGTFDVGSVTQATSPLPGGPEGMVYVPGGSPLFPDPAMLVSEFTAGVVSTYLVDANGDPMVGTRHLFVIGLTGAEGATIDAQSGDFLFSTFGGGDRIIVVRGFAPID